MFTIVVGGRGQMGSLFVRLLQDQNLTVACFDQDDWHNDDKIKQLKEADWVMISVPIAKTLKIIEKVAPHLKPNAILSDLTSVKYVPLQAMLAHHPGPVLALHPMFGPQIQAPYSSYNLIHCGGREPSKTQPALNLLQQIGFTLHQLTAQQHDEIMDMIQACHYFILDAEQQQLTNLNPINEAIGYNQRLQVIKRYHQEDPELYRSIIYFDQRRVALLSQLPNIARQLTELLNSTDHTQMHLQQLSLYWQVPLEKKNLQLNLSVANYVFLLLLEMTLIMQQGFNLRQLQQLASPSFAQRLESMSKILTFDLMPLRKIIAQYSTQIQLATSPS